MLIRAEQKAILARASLRMFQDRTYAHLLEYFPRHCALIGEERMREVIQFGLGKATGYGLTNERCVRAYIEFMCLLGGRFDTDPLLPWAAEILTDRRSSSEIERGDRLYDRAWEYIARIVPDYRDASGQPTTARFVFELRQVRELPGDPFGPQATAAFTSSVVDWIARLFPAKFRYAGAPLVGRVVATAIDKASGYDISGVRGTTLMAMLMFVLGSGFDDDPLIPWASATLGDRTVPGGERADRLFAEGVHFLRRWWDSAPASES